MHHIMVHWHTAKVMHDQSAERLIRAIRQVLTYLFCKIIERDESIDFEFAGSRLGLDLILALVILIMDIADHRLDEILQGDDAIGTAILIKDDRDLLSTCTHLTQCWKDTFSPGKEDDGAHQITDQ